MVKDSFYFPHDSNARSDPKCIKLRRLAGLAGLGLYWCVIEHLRSASGYKLSLEMIDEISYELRAERELFEKLFECSLLQKDERFFWSDSLIKRMEPMDAKREQARIAGKTSAQKRSGSATKQDDGAENQQSFNGSSTDDEQTFNGRSTDVQPVYENKVNKNKSNENIYSPNFDAFWSAYPRREGKSSAYKAWKARIKDGASEIDLISAAKKYSCYCAEENRDPKYIKLPATFLNPDWREWLNHKSRLEMIPKLHPGQIQVVL